MKIASKRLKNTQFSNSRKFLFHFPIFFSSKTKKNTHNSPIQKISIDILVVAQPQFKVNPFNRLNQFRRLIFKVMNFHRFYFSFFFLLCLEYIWFLLLYICRNTNKNELDLCVLIANGISDDIYVREKPPKLGKSSCRKFIDSLQQ